MTFQIPSYAYTYVKIGYLKMIIMDEPALKKLRSIENFEEFLEFIKPYYPDMKIEAPTVEEVESKLYNIFIKVIGKIMLYSPDDMRHFLRTFLLKYEIYNIKQIIIGTIVGLSKEERKENVNFTVEEYLDNEEFIEKLLELYSLEEIEYFMRKTRYYEVIREGLLYFRNNHEIFVLDAFLDQLYYRNLVYIGHSTSKEERNAINLFVDYAVEVYNLSTIYRGIKNNVDRNLLSQIIINNYLILTPQIIKTLIALENTESFIDNLKYILSSSSKIKDLYHESSFDEDHLNWALESLYIEYFFTKVSLQIGDIEYITIYKILELLIMKEKEIKFDILPKAVQLIDKKFELLRNKEI